MSRSHHPRKPKFDLEAHAIELTETILSPVLKMVTNSTRLGRALETTQLEGSDVLNSLPTDDKVRAFARMMNEASLTQRASNYGLPQTAADKVAHTSIANLIRLRYPDRYVVGEEATDQDWDRWESASIGAICYNLDSVDGSSCHDSLAIGHSSNLSMHVRTAKGRDQLLLTITLNSSYVALIYIAPNLVFTWADDGHGLIGMDEPGYLEDRRPGYVATVGAQPDARRKTAVLQDTTMSWGLPPFEKNGRTEQDPPLTVWTLGGAPAGYGLAVGRLDALICVEFQTIHDTTHVPALLALRFTAWGWDSELREVKKIEKDDVMACYDQLRRPTDPGSSQEDHHPIPPMVLTTNTELGKKLAYELFSRSDSELQCIDPNPVPVRLRVVGDDHDD